MNRLVVVFLLGGLTGCIADGTDEVGSVEEALGHFHHDRDPLIHQDGPVGEWLYRTLAKGWLKWAMGQPYSTGPIEDPTGASCGIDQRGPVFYLAGTDGGPAERDCDIPRNKALFIPLVNHWIIPPEEFVDTPEEMAEFIAFAESYFPENRAYTCQLDLRLDGEDILADTAERDEEFWTEIYDPFPIVLDDDNFTGGPGGLFPAALTAGHYALLKPLSRGPHTLELAGVICDETTVYFETSVVYNLDVR
jgi:hypothetical protein